MSLSTQPSLKKIFIAGALAAIGTAIILCSGRVSTNSSTGVLAVSASTPASPAETPTPTTSSIVVIGGTTIPVELERTNAQIQKGLSGRTSLDAGSGMLFLFSKPAIYRFWMPDMHFPIDIIWINSGQIVSISKNVPTTFDPTHPIWYRPTKPAQYVLEVNAGFSAAHHFSAGDSVTFKNI